MAAWITAASYPDDCPMKIWIPLLFSRVSVDWQDRLSSANIAVNSTVEHVWGDIDEQMLAMHTIHNRIGMDRLLV